MKHETAEDMLRARSRRSADSLKVFMGNLSPDYAGKRFFKEASPEEIARRVLDIMVREVDLFEKKLSTGDGKPRFRVDGKEKLIPRPTSIETEGVEFKDFQLVFDACQKPLVYDELMELWERLKKKSVGARE